MATWKAAKNIIVVALSIGIMNFVSNEVEAKEVKQMNEAEKRSYSLGIRYGESIRDEFGQKLDQPSIIKGISEALAGKSYEIPNEEIDRYVLQLQQQMQADQEKEHLAKSGTNLKASQNYLQNYAKQSGVTATNTGLLYRVIKAGNGKKPARTDRVKVHYEGKLIDGTVFDSSYSRAEPAEFPVSGVIPGWIEALTLMPQGSTWELVIPANLAYGERGAGQSIGPNQALIFKVELLEILK